MYVFYPVDPSFCRNNYKPPHSEARLYRYLTVRELSSMRRSPPPQTAHHYHQHPLDSVLELRGRNGRKKVSTCKIVITQPHQPFFFLVCLLGGCLSVCSCVFFFSCAPGVIKASIISLVHLNRFRLLACLCASRCLRTTHFHLSIYLTLKTF